MFVIRLAAFWAVALLFLKLFKRIGAAWADFHIVLVGKFDGFPAGGKCVIPEELLFSPHREDNSRYKRSKTTG